MIVFEDTLCVRFDERKQMMLARSGEGMRGTGGRWMGVLEGTILCSGYNGGIAFDLGDWIFIFNDEFCLNCLGSDKIVYGDDDMMFVRLIPVIEAFGRAPLIVVRLS